MRKSTKFFLLEIVALAIIVNFNNVFLLGIFFVSLHEVMHIFIGKLYGCNLYKVNISLSGANAELKDLSDLGEGKRFLIYISGPSINLFMAFIFYIIGLKNDLAWINICYEINLGLFLFNMLPAYPLDGSRILEIILSRFTTFRRSKKIIGILSYCISTFLILSFFFLLILHKVNITLILVGILMIYSTIVEKRTTSYIMMNDLIKKRKKIEENEYLDNRFISVYYKKSLLNLLTLVEKNKFNSFFILDEEITLLKIIHEDEVLEALKLYGDITIEEYLNKVYNNE